MGDNSSSPDHAPTTTDGQGNPALAASGSESTLVERLRNRIAALECAIQPFAAYAIAATAYGRLHRGSQPDDNKSMAYVQTEMGHSGNITWGDFKFAAELMPNAVYSGESTRKRQAALSDGASSRPPVTSDAVPGMPKETQ
jgi:hypothetical protein